MLLMKPIISFTVRPILALALALTLTLTKPNPNPKVYWLVSGEWGKGEANMSTSGDKGVENGSKCRHLQNEMF